MQDRRRSLCRVFRANDVDRELWASPRSPDERSEMQEQVFELAGRSRISLRSSGLQGAMPKRQRNAGPGSRLRWSHGSSRPVSHIPTWYPKNSNGLVRTSSVARLASQSRSTRCEPRERPCRSGTRRRAVEVVVHLLYSCARPNGRFHRPAASRASKGYLSSFCRSRQRHRQGRRDDENYLNVEPDHRRFRKWAEPGTGKVCSGRSSIRSASSPASRPCL